MRASVVIPVLLGAGALAHPHLKLNNPFAHGNHKRGNPAKVITTTIGNEVQILEYYVQTVYGDSSSSTTPPTPSVTSSSAPIVAAPQKLKVNPVAANPVAANQPKMNEQPANNAASSTPASITPSVTPTSNPPAQSSAVPVSVPETGGNDGAPQSGGVSILETANKYRAMQGFPPFEYDSQLAGNSAKTNAATGAMVMTHQLNTGSNAQCIAQASPSKGSYKNLTPFEMTYLGWLCEIDDSKLTTLCKDMMDFSKMIVDKGNPGHAKILQGKYKYMGCNYQDTTQDRSYDGQWTCDFKL